jgi:hypothetical protein
MIPSDMIQVLLVIMDINYVQKIQELVVLLHTIKRNFYLVFNFMDIYKPVIVRQTRYHNGQQYSHT